MSDKKKKKKSKKKKPWIDKPNLSIRDELRDFKRTPKSEFYNRAFGEILEHLFVVEGQAHINITRIREVLHKHLTDAQIDNIDINEEKYLKTIERMSDLLFTILTARAMGVGHYEKEVVIAEIIRIWGLKGSISDLRDVIKRK